MFNDRQERNARIRRYDRRCSVVFFKTADAFGGLSNMAAGFPLSVNDVAIRTSEALYQACRFPHRPEIQDRIIAQKSPMAAKMVAKTFQHDTRPDWDRVRVEIMRWCLRVKLAQNYTAFSQLLLATGDAPIVEQSRKDEFWGAKPIDAETLVGSNVLGRLLMELRDLVRSGDTSKFAAVPPLLLQDFRLLGEPIRAVQGRAPVLPTGKAAFATPIPDLFEN